MPEIKQTIYERSKTDIKVIKAAVTDLSVKTNDHDRRTIHLEAA